MKCEYCVSAGFRPRGVAARYGVAGQLSPTLYVASTMVFKLQTGTIQCRSCFIVLLFAKTIGDACAPNCQRILDKLIVFSSVCQVFS